MIAVFFAWKGTHHDLHAVGLHDLGRRWDAAPLGPAGLDHAGTWIGILYAEHHNARVIAAAKHQNLMVMPGAHGTLTKTHADHLAHPDIKPGAAFGDVLDIVRTHHGHAWADRNAY